MKTLQQLAIVGMAIAVSAVPALAGTKYSANLVPNSAVYPPVAPTISSKGSVKLDDKGKISVSLAGVVEPGPTSACEGGLNAGATCTVNGDCDSGVCLPVPVPVTTSGSYNDIGVLDGTQYVVIIKLFIPGIAGLFDRVDYPLPIDLKKGKGKRKTSAAALFGFIPEGIGRTLEIVGTEVWGPLGGGGVAACQAAVVQQIPVTFVPVGGSPDPACRGGSQIGMSGLDVPPPPPMP